MSVNEDSNTWRLRTPGGIPFKLLSRRGSFEDESAGTTEVYAIRADTLEAFVLEAFPPPTDDGTLITYPKFPTPFGQPSLPTKRLSWEALTPGLPCDPFGSDASAPAGTYDPNIKLTVEFGTSVDSDSDPDPNDPKTFLEISANASGEFLNAPIRGTARWESQTGDEVKDINVPQTIVQPEVEWTIRWSRIPWTFFNATLMTRLRSKLGKVNDAGMTLLHNAPEETILFLGFSIRQQFTWRTGFIGTPPISLEMKFLEKNFISEFDNGGKVSETQVTHNHFYRPGKGYQILLKDGKNKVYAQDDLTAIFTG